jgi:WD40 repeat protein
MYSVLSVAFSPDGVHIVSGSQDTTARVWSARTGKLLAVAEGHSDCVWSVAFSPDGAYIVSGSTDRTVRVWDARTGKQVSLLKGHKKRVLSVGFSPDGAHIVSGSLDMTVWVWDLRTCKQLLLLKGHCNRISSVAFSSDGKYVISCDRQGNKLEWNVESTVFVFSHYQAQSFAHMLQVYAVANPTCYIICLPPNFRTLTMGSSSGIKRPAGYLGSDVQTARRSIYVGYHWSVAEDCSCGMEPRLQLGHDMVRLPSWISTM